MLCQACHGKQHRLNIKALLIPLAIIFLSSVSCMGTQDQRSYGQRLQEIIRKQDSILLKLSDLENLQNSTNDTMHVKLAETENGINLKIDRLSGLSPTDSSGKPIGIVEVRIYIIGDKWTQWRYCTNINDAITYLNNFK